MGGFDQACIDIINQQKVTAKNDPTDLLNRIDKQHGIHTIEHAAKLGLGSRQYTLINIDKWGSAEKDNGLQTKNIAGDTLLNSLKVFSKSLAI